MTHRWMKFWPQDWEGDPALKACGLAAQGLWMRLVCIMHRAEDYGHLTLAGRAPTTKQIASMAGAGEREVAKLLAELEEAGVFSRTEAGVIYSRRMLRDKASSEEAREFGKRGGNPALKAEPTKAVIPSGNGEVNPPLNPPLILQEAEAEAEAERTTSLRSVDAVPASFDARTDLFQTGLATVRRLTGLPDGRARALIGKCLKASGDNATIVSDAIARCADTRPADVAPWLIQACDAPKFRNGFLAVIAEEGWTSAQAEPDDPPNQFLIGGADHGPH